MIRTEIYLPKQLYDRIKRRAGIAGKADAEIIRELLDQAVRTPQRHAGKRLDRLVNLNLQGPPDLAQHVDQYLYDDQR